MNRLSEVNGEWILSFLDEQNKWNSHNDAEEPSVAIETAETVHVLEFRGNTLGIDAGERISKALEKHPELKRALWSDMFTGRMKSEIPPVLRSLCGAMMSTAVNLVELDLSDNAFGPIGAEGIEHFLQSPSAYSLQILKLNNNGLGAGGKVIANALKNCCNNAKRDGRKLCLKSFIAGRNRLEMPGAIALAEAFKEIGTLEEINMHQNGINAKGIEALADSFKNNPSLRVINLSDNTFTSAGAKAVAKVLPKLTKLEVLHFGDCLCRNSGTVALIESIHPAIHSKLREINLSGNELGPPIIERILVKMAADFSLESLVLHTNNLGERFLDVKTRYTQHGFVDLGEESDDQGSLDNDDEEALSEISDKEDGDERAEIAEEFVRNEHSQMNSRNMNMEDIVMFIRRPTPDVLRSFMSHQEAVIAIIQEELSARVHDLTAAFLYSLGTLASLNEADFQTQMSIAILTEMVIKTALEVKRWPVSTVDQICNTLIGYASVTQSENGEVFYGDVRGVLFLFSSLLKRGYLKTYIPFLKFAVGVLIKQKHPEVAKDIDEFMAELRNGYSMV